MNDIVDMIRGTTVCRPHPAVYISGGLDSTIVLYHLVESGIDVFAYTARFGEDDEDCEAAKRVANWCGVVHKEVEIKNFIRALPRILSGFDRPRYNVWVSYLAGQAYIDGRSTVYAGEGSDEHFGGYANKDYLKAWADHLSFILPTYEQTCRKFGLNLHLPFTRLSSIRTRPYYCPPEKQRLRDAYHKILPDYVINRKKKPPEFSNYWKLWEREIKPYFPYYSPESVEDIKGVLQFLATEAWLKANSVKGNRYYAEGDSDVAVHGRGDIESGGRHPEKTD